jgi:hypothetical protein
LRYSSEEDADGDGASDLREYLSSTDPTVSDREIEVNDRHWDKVLPVIFLIMSAALFSGAFIMAFKRKKDGQASDPVPSGPPFPVPAAMAPPSDQSVDQPFNGPSPPDRPASVDDWLEAAIRDHDDNAFSEIGPMDLDQAEGVPDKAEAVDATSIEGGAVG